MGVLHMMHFPLMDAPSIFFHTSPSHDHITRVITVSTSSPVNICRVNAKVPASVNVFTYDADEGS